jgi:phosphoribosyl 1,2-cyclic phosphodiesterase/ActR/RegA family two-component response regulator
MAKKREFFIVDDDRIFIKFLTKYLQSDTSVVAHTISSAKALTEILARKPDCVILDIMMPEIDGLALCKKLRAEASLDDTKIIILSGKTYEFDRKQALSLGADGYITKPVDPDTITTQIERIMEDRIEMTFWGVRGTLPVPGATAIHYGGNTSCVSLAFPKGSLFIFDAGTGIKVLSGHLLRTSQSILEAKIFLSHPHWDHINGLPFFAPLYMQGNEFEIFGPSHGDVTVRELVAGQMDGVYFPIKIKEFGATVSFRDLQEESLEVDRVKIKTILLNHPGHCLGYRVEYKSRAICYVTDNELFPKDSRFYNRAYVAKLVQFVQGSDALVTDCTYSDQEYAEKVGWGHSAVSQVVELAHQARVKQLFLHHHDPDQSDQEIEAKLTTARDLLSRRQAPTQCFAPQEKQVFRL